MLGFALALALPFTRSEEHTSELQSHYSISYAVFCLKKNHQYTLSLSLIHIYALDETNKPWAYIRIKDENILATPVHLKMWQHSKKPEGALVTFTEREQRLLDVLKEKEKLSLNQCCKLCRLNHKTTCELLADFIRFGLVELVFHGHKMCIRDR